MYTLFMGEHLPTSTGELMSGPYTNLLDFQNNYNFLDNRQCRKTQAKSISLLFSCKLQVCKKNSKTKVLPLTREQMGVIITHFTCCTCEKKLQMNFSSHNFSIENSYF